MPEKRPDRTLGPGHDEFWAYCGKGELRLQCCDACGHVSWPVVSACEQCGGAAFSWRRMSGRGRVASWCSFERDYYGGVLPLPWDTILVELEEGPLFISNPQGFAVDDITPQMQVAVDFLDCEDAAGPFRLPVFRRV
ncbi:MAG TPA: OB-fold domain-containing protein [Novosphingobium sp.]